MNRTRARWHLSDLVRWCCCIYALGMTNPVSSRIRLTASLFVGLLYGLLARMIFGAITLDADEASGWMATMSLAFIFATPLVVGALTVFLAPLPYRLRVSYALIAPLVSTLLVLAVYIAFQIELLVCAVMLLPAFAVSAILGGVLALVVSRSLARRAAGAAGRSLMLSLFAVMPLFGASLDRFFPQVASVEHVESSIEIAATPGAVWDNIVRVRAIQPNERRWLLAHAVGIPRPVEAKLDRDGLGALRQGIFDNGLTFHEVIEVWEPGQRVRFSIAPYAPSVYAPFDNIGKQYLDLINAEYRIQDLGDGRVRLTLGSHHKVNTRYNAYSRVLTRYFMAQFQDDLLRIIKTRCETTP